MKIEMGGSGNTVRRGYGRSGWINLEITPENELEKAFLRMAYSGKRKVFIWESGNATIQVEMPRGKND